MSDKEFFNELMEMSFNFASKYNDLCAKMRRQAEKYTLLYAEDNIVTQKIFKQMVDKHARHFELILVSDGKKAMEMFIRRDGAIDLVMLDVQMPHFTGLQVLEQIRAFEKDNHIKKPAKVCIISSMPSYEDDAYRLGADLFYTKESGFKIVDLKSTIETLLGIKL